MLKCDGYKMFHGAVKITPAPGFGEPYDMIGTWLFKPNTGCWYCNPDDGSLTKSIPADIMSDFREDVG